MSWEDASRGVWVSQPPVHLPPFTSHCLTGWVPGQDSLPVARELACPGVWKARGTQLSINSILIFV